VVGLDVAKVDNVTFRDTWNFGVEVFHGPSNIARGPVGPVHGGGGVLESAFINK